MFLYFLSSYRPTSSLREFFASYIDFLQKMYWIFTNFGNGIKQLPVCDFLLVFYTNQSSQSIILKVTGHCINSNFQISKVNVWLTLTLWPKVKSDGTKRFPMCDFLFAYNTYFISQSIISWVISVFLSREFEFLFEIKNGDQARFSSG